MNFGPGSILDVRVIIESLLEVMVAFESAVLVVADDVRDGVATHEMPNKGCIGAKLSFG